MIGFAHTNDGNKKHDGTWNANAVGKNGSKRRKKSLEGKTGSIR